MRTDHEGPDETRTYRNTPEGALDLDVFLPAATPASGLRSAIVFFFGGGWVKGDRGQFHPQSRALAQRGMVAMSADYRVRDRHDTTPWDAVNDARTALRYVHDHAAEWQIDSERILAGGGSAGGHLAAMTFYGVDAGGVHPRPPALVLFNPVVDTASILVERGYGPEACREISPIHRIAENGNPPMILFYGTEDVRFIGPGRAFVEAVRAKGERAEIVETGGAGHGFFNREPHLGETTAEMIRFLEGLGYLQAPGK